MFPPKRFASHNCFVALCHERVFLSKQKDHTIVSRIYRLPVVEKPLFDAYATLKTGD